MQIIELVEDNTGELARQALDEGYQAVALEVGRSYEALQRENTRLYNALNKLLCVGKFDEAALPIVQEAQEAIADSWAKHLAKEGEANG